MLGFDRVLPLDDVLVVEDFLEEREDDFRSGCAPSLVWHRDSDFLCRSPIGDL